MHATEETRLRLGAGFLSGKWTWPDERCAPPWAAVLLMTTRSDQCDFEHELVLELANHGVSVWHLRHEPWTADAVHLAWQECSRQPRVSRVRVGVLAAECALPTVQAVFASGSFSVKPRCILASKPPATPGILALRPAVRDLTAQVKECFLPSWEISARRAGTAIG